MKWAKMFKILYWEDIIMKKVISILLVLVLAATMFGCANSKGDDAQNSENTAVTSEANDSGNKKVLVAYFSASGNTKAAAEYIAKNKNADTFEIVPKDKYTDEDLDYANDSSRVNIEHDNEEKRNVELEVITPDNWDNYDTVFIGYPIWWGSAAWPVDNFVKQNDFDGKTVIPFCTSASSGLGESGELLKNMSGKGNWLTGERFSSDVSEDEVKSWVNGLDY